MAFEAEIRARVTGRITRDFVVLGIHPCPGVLAVMAPDAVGILAVDGGA